MRFAVLAVAPLIGLTACATAPGLTTSSVGPTAIQPNMTRQQVVEAMGQPTGFSSAPGGIECLTFDMRQTPLAVSPMTVQQFVVLKDGKVIRSEKTAPLQAWTGQHSMSGGSGFSCSA